MKTATTFLLFFGLLHFTTTAQVLEQDSLALVAFYNSTGGPNWNNNSNWLMGPVSSWYGVTVEGNRVVHLGSSGSFAFNNLNGQIPSDIVYLTGLKKLTIGNNSGLEGSIPEEIGNLQLLIGLGIGNCSLSGAIPNTIGNCSYLEFVNLWENNLTGPIPPEIGNLDSLIFLDLHDNQLSGTIPPELGDCDNLQELWLNDNQLTGTIPEEVSYLDNLQILNVNNNQLSGELPEYLSNLFYQNPPFYISLFVSGNQFSGPVSEAWGDISFNIDALDLSHNQFTSLPNVSSNWLMTFFNINNNKLTFESIESHYQSYQQGLYYFFYYRPQDDMLTEIDTALVPGSSYSIYSGTGGEFTSYKWYKNGEMILESPDADTLHLVNIMYADTGTYTCRAENSLLNLLTLYRKPVHISIDTGVNINAYTINENMLKLYPNPTTGIFTLENTNLIPDSGYQLSITNSLGICVYNNPKAELSNDMVIDLSCLPAGIYLVVLKNNKQYFTQKLIINKQGTNR